MSKVWFITGTSKGFGRIWAEAALERGDKVAATARNADSVADLAERYGEENALALALDVTDKEAVRDAVAKAREHFGRLDVVVNNAGYGLFGSIEEISEEQARDQIETNLFGALWVTQAVLPVLREQGSGHVIQVSSIGGVHAFPGIGLYHASKWGLEGFSQSLAGEVADLGVKVTLVEPGGFSTDWAGPSAVSAEKLDAYEPVREANAERFSNPETIGDPEATGPAILELVDAADPPLRVFFGATPLGLIRDEYAHRVETWEQWNELSQRAHGNAETSAA
ncbi:MAG: SDR family oxidoreductase [Actinomycetota bacterium]|nr:SDR family oxidoreductase [Actinomycetota bacterium]